MRVLLVASLLLFSANASAESEWEAHSGWWFAADFALTPVGSYKRDVSEPADKREVRSFGGNLAASAFYVGHGPFGIGAHVAPTLTALDLPTVAGRVLTVDVGFDPFARLSWDNLDLTFRLPAGLSTGHVNWLRTPDGLVREDNPQLGSGITNDDLGIGFHLGPQLGAVWWFSDFTGVRMESGLSYHRMKFDEGSVRRFPGAVAFETIRGEVLHNSLAWTISIGFVRRFNPKSLPDENGPPLPTPDYYQPYPLTSNQPYPSTTLRM